MGMTVRSLTLALFVTLSASAAVYAACPPPTAGETAAEIKANEQRLVCLQNELSQDTSAQRQKQELDALNSRVRQLELDQQMRSIEFKPPQIIVPPVVVPQPQS